MEKPLPFWFGYKIINVCKNDGGEHFVKFSPNIHNIFGHIYCNKLLLLTSLIRSTSERSYIRFSAQISACCARSVCTNCNVKIQFSPVLYIHVGMLSNSRILHTI